MAEGMETFDYVQLSEVDPSQQVLPPDVYTLKILKANLKSGIGKESGNPYQLTNLAMAVTNHPDFAGRRLYESFFPSDFSKKALRRIMDATGIQQEPNQTFAEWLEALTAAQPEFRVKVNLVEDRDRAGNARSTNAKGECATINKIVWFEVHPA